MSSDSNTDVPGLGDAGPTFPSFDGDATDATVTVAEPRGSLDLPPSTEIGRYRIEEMIGRGGMGVVFRAHDPELERPVALKLLRARGRTPQRASRATQRLLREAQALAKLSHPNVVAVHDVGEVDVGVFVAMEFIEGQTLRELIRGKSLTTERAVEIFIEAGRGLAAAHAHGLIHRDFKPANVMIDGRGRVRVLDFGLARAEGTTSDAESDDSSYDESDDPSISEDRGSSRNLLSSPITAHGAIVGTPAYMPSEQRQGVDVDARSDQFSYCVAFYEALAGERPIVDAQDPDRERRLLRKNVPRWLRRIVLRGLGEVPSGRYPNMDALLAALTRAGGRWRRNTAIAGAVVATTAVLVWAIVLRAPSVSETDRCLVGASQADKEWSAQHRERLRVSFGKSDVVHAADTAGRVSRLVSLYAEEWKTQYSATCKAHHEQGRLSADLLDVSMDCLTNRLHSFTSTITVLSVDVDRTVVNEAVRAATRLPSIIECTDVTRLRQTFPPPKDTARRATVQRIGAQLAKAEAMLRAGKSKRGMRLLTKIQPELDKLDHPPLSARAYLYLGNLALDLNDHKKATATLKLAAEKAAQAGDDRTTAQAWLLRMQSMLLRSKFDEATALGETAKVSVLRNKDDSDLHGQFNYNMAWLLVMKDEKKGARAHADKALADFRRKTPPDNLRVAQALIMSGNVAITMGDSPLAEKSLGDAIDLLTRSLGKDHPDLADAHHNLAHLLVQQEQYDKALKHAKAASRIVRSAFDKKHPRRASALWLLGRIQYKRGKLKRARRLVTQALKIFGAHAVGNPTQAALATNILALILAAQGHHERADKRFAEARTRFTAVFGKDDSAILDVLEPWVQTKLALGQPKAAAKLEREAAAMRKALAKD